MPFHWCYQETEALLILLSAIPLIGLYFKRLHAHFHAKWKTICHHGHQGKDCCPMPNDPFVAVHDEGPEPEDEAEYSPYDRKHWHQPEQITKEDAEYFNTNDHSSGAGVKSEWDAISQEDLVERLGKKFLDDFYTELLMHKGFSYIHAGEINWYVNTFVEVKAEVRGRVFVYAVGFWMEIG